MSITVIKKISVGLLVGRMTAKRVSEAGGRIHCIDLAGYASGETVTGQSNFPPGYWTAFLGDFVAVPRCGERVGQTFRAPKLFPPGLVEDMLKAAIAKGPAEFALSIFAMEDHNSPVGFSYTVETRMKEEKTPATLLAFFDPPPPNTVGEVPTPTEKKTRK